jgi:hypothetical protein
MGEDHVHMHADELGYQRRQLIDVLRPLPFNDDVGAFDVAEVTQARPQPLTCGTLEGKAKKPDARRLRMLPMRPQRPCDRATEQSDELTPPHSITSSARASSVGGTSRPSVLAVCKLITNSNLVGCKIGKSAGFSPLSTRPV